MSGRAQRHKNLHQATGLWYDIHYTRILEMALPRIAGVFSDVTDRKRAEAALRESEERQALLIKLSDALRGELDAQAAANDEIALVGGDGVISGDGHCPS